MAECEYCGDQKCFKRACIDALTALAAYYDAEAAYRSAVKRRDDAKATAELKELAATGDSKVTLGRWRETALP